jgi:hypothetical protein
VRKPEWKRPLEKLRSRWENNTKVNFSVVGWGDMDWFGPNQDREKWWALVNAVMNFQVP